MSFRTNFVYLEGKVFQYEERVTPTGKTISKFTILLSNGPDKSGTFVPVDAWELSEKLRQLLNSNAGKCRVGVQGDLQMDQWEDKATKAKRSKLKINGRQINYLGLAKESDPEEKATSAYKRSAPKAASKAVEEPEEPAEAKDNAGDDCPF